MKPKPATAYVRINQAAKALGIGADLVETAAERGELKLEVIRLGRRGFRFVRQSDLQRLLDNQAGRPR